MTVRDKGIAGGMILLGTLVLAPALARGAVASTDGFTAQQVQYPPGVTAEKIAAGKTLYESARCATCHGADGKGKPGFAEDMTDSTWKFAKDGTYEEMVRVIKEGLTRAQTGSRAMQPAEARELTDEQIAAIAAYSWSLSHKTS